MKSHAHFKSHPIHPLLIAFPIGFLYGGALADLLGGLFNWQGLWTVGGYLSIATVVTGLAAGVAGFIDYLYVVPPHSSARGRATWHMLVNVAALALVTLGWFFRDWETFAPSWLTILLEWSAGGLMGLGGWLGGTLVYRNQIGVDRRFAHAGRWHEQTIHGTPGQTVAVNGADQMKPGQMWLLRWARRRLVLARTEEGYAMFDDHCTHHGGALADGALICGTVQCPWHGSQFDVRSGEVKAGPAEKPIPTYAAELRDGQVFVTLPAAEKAPA